MKASQKASNNFLTSLGLLVAALVLFVFVVMSGSSTPPVAPVADDVTASIAAQKRDNMRNGTKGKRIVISDSQFDPKPEPVVEEEPKRKPAPLDDAFAGATDELPPMEPAAGVDPDVQAAIDLIDNGNVDAAVVKLEEILRKDPRNEQALVELAMIHLLDLKQSGKAISYLEQVVAVNPQNRIVLSELVSLYEEEGRADEGLAYMMQQHDANPDSPALSYGIGQMLATMGRDGEAIPYLEKATQSADNPVRAHRDLAEAYSRNGDRDRAIESYKSAIALQEKEVAEKVDKGMPVTFNKERLNFMRMDLAREYIERGDREAAEEVLNQIEDEMPEDDAVTALRDQLQRKG